MENITFNLELKATASYAIKHISTLFICFRNSSALQWNQVMSSQQLQKLGITISYLGSQIGGNERRMNEWIQLHVGYIYLLFENVTENQHKIFIKKTRNETVVVDD